MKSGGEYYGVGAGVGISGFRADLGIADDLFGSREDAYSETVRRKRWDWYVDDFSARLKPGAKRILIATRWHQEDVAGLVLDSDALSASTCGTIPRATTTAPFLRQRERETSPMMWAALYQQRPAPETGDYPATRRAAPKPTTRSPKRRASWRRGP